MDIPEMSDIVPESPPTTNESRTAGDTTESSTAGDTNESSLAGVAPKLSSIQFEWDPMGSKPVKENFDEPLLFTSKSEKAAVGAIKRVKGLRWFDPATVRGTILSVHMNAQVQGKSHALSPSDLLRPVLEIIDDFQDMADGNNTEEDFMSRPEFMPTNKRLKIWEDDFMEVSTDMEGGEFKSESSGDPCEECEKLKAQLQQEKDKVKVLEVRLAAIMGGDNI
ncbi:hypothetical protein L211DRAFT_889943 [Terfezia boudieri ATCC MYA-4762]|uniref:Uncharacterized protein n=1 Tax=Terfezia boudieri ATCC MYA-4762 TaxID=1051890 RepID=A0A3N4LKM2_9PEZI|nr:hypothetical protein L211DRAFT_889943 [Terfezia boudieri ATCC MYA-4762]